MTKPEPKFLILSLKWSRPPSESLVWYRPASAGYTTRVNSAGLYSESEAAAIADGVITMAVPEWAAKVECIRVVPNESAVIESLRRNALKTSSPLVPASAKWKE